MGKVCAFRGNRLPYVVREPTTYKDTAVSSILFSPHIVTHIDLPWGIPWKANRIEMKREMEKRKISKKYHPIDEEYNPFALKISSLRLKSQFWVASAS